MNAKKRPIVRISRSYFRRSVAIVLWIVSSFSVAATAMADGENLGQGENPSSAEAHRPAAWRFTMPKGNAARGRAVFQKFECYNCHKVEGENFPYPVDYGPELSQKAPLYPMEFFAESIINPNAVIAKEDRGLDGKSPMSQEHLEKMTLREFIDLTSYIASLKPPAAAKTMTGVGKVIAITPAAGEVVLDHENLKGSKDTMTMGYKVSAPALLDGLKPGDRVRFSIELEKNAIVKRKKFPNARIPSLVSSKFWSRNAAGWIGCDALASGSDCAAQHP